MKRYSRIGVIVIIMALAGGWTHPTGAATTPPAPAGLSAAEWRDIQAQLPAADPLAGPAGYLKSPRPMWPAYFGTGLQMAGDTLVVGAPWEKGPGAMEGAGAAYVFVRGAAGWTRQADLRAPNPDPHDYFGSSLAIAGDTIVVGVPNEDGDGSSPANNSMWNAGAAYVFTRTDGVWTQQTYLKSSSIGNGYMFGASVAIEGETMMVGMPGAPPFPGSVVYEFGRTEGVWSERAALPSPSGQVALSGDTLVVGAPWEEGPSGITAAGAAYVFERINNTWTQQARLTAPTPANYDIFGAVVDIDGDTIVIGAPITFACCRRATPGSPADLSSSKTGEVFVFVRASGPGSATWVRQASLIGANSNWDDSFGSAVAIEGDRILVGATGEASNGNPSDNSLMGAGAAYLFVRTNGAWTQHGYRKAFNRDAGDHFGAAVALSGDTIAVAAPDEDSDGSSPADNSTENAGAVYIQQIGARLSMPRVQR